MGDRRLNRRPALRRALRWLQWAALGLGMLVAGYAVAGLVGGAIPANTSWRPPAQGIRIYVQTNGVHTGIVVPASVAGIDWRPLVRAEDLADPRYARYGWLSFGWGDEDFYLHTPRWRDVKIATVLAAATGSDRTLVHVDHLPEPRGDPNARSIVLRPEEYRRLATQIRASFRTGSGGRAARRPGYGANDVFYEGAGRYSALMTCNSWTGRALRRAGVRIGRWTPFPVTVMAWFPKQ